MEGRRREFIYVAAVFLQKIITALADVLWLVLLAELIGEAIPEDGVTGDVGKMAQYILGLVLLTAWKRMGYCFGRSLTLKLQNMVRFRLNCRIVEKTAKIPYRLLEDYAFNEWKQALQDHIDGSTDKSFVWYMVQKSGNFMVWCTRILGMSLLLAWASIPLGLLFFLLEIGHFLMTTLGLEQEDTFVKKNSLRKRYLDELALGREGAVERSLFSYADCITGKRDREEAIVRREALFLLLEKRKTELVNQILILLTYVTAEIGLAALLADGRIALGYFIGLSIGMSSLTEKDEEGNALRYVQREKRFIQQWKRFMNLPEMEGLDEGKEESAGRESGIEEFETLEFRKVSFRYPRTGRYVLRDLSFQLTRGGYYAFVGANGSGKTTIVKLLSGLYDNYEGEIRLNGTELREIPFRERRRMFAILFQDAARYEDTIVRNIMPDPQTIYDMDNPPTAFRGKDRPALSSKHKIKMAEKPGGKKPIEECEGREAAGRRLAQEFVREWEDGRSDRFPQGIDTFLGNTEKDGVMLSTGEWQQLLIARELAQSAQVRVMDEPMASLDIFRQGRFYEQFTREIESHTTILFSHHMAAVKDAKRIFVLREGVIVEEGSHEELMGKKELYAKLYETQCETNTCL